MKPIGDTKPYIQFRPVGETIWCVIPENLDALKAECESADQNECTLEIRFVQMTDEEYNSRPEFDGW